MTTTKINNRLCTLLCLLCMCSLPIMAQKTFTLEDLNYGGKNYYNMVPKNRYTTWWGDELLRLDVESVSVINKKSGKETTLFTLKQLNTWLKADNNNEARTCTNLVFPYPNEPLVLVETNTQRYLVNFKKKKTAWQAPIHEEHFTDWSSASKAVAYVKNNNLYITDANGKENQITTDGTTDIVYGQVVHRNEFGIYKGTFWSNDGKSLAFYRMDQSMVDAYPLVDLHETIATPDMIRYPMAGKTSHEVTIGIHHLANNKTIYLQTGNPKDRYFTNIQWSKDNKILYLIELNRKQNHLKLDAYNAETGKLINTLYEEKSDKYIDPEHPIEFLPWNDKQFILQSQKDGYNHLYLFNNKGEELLQITSGKWVVLDLMGFVPARKEVLILSTEAGDIQNNIYAVNIETGARRLLDNGKGCHANTYGEDGSRKPAVSASGQWIVDNYSEPTVPRQIDIIETAKAKRIAYFVADNPWKDYIVPQYHCGTIKAADGVTDLYYRMVTPPDFDSNKKYPAVIYVYGGPHARNVEARWNYMSRGWETYMAQKGYVLFILDNRGSKDRGLAFEQATFHKLGTEEMKDQMKGVEFLKQQPYIDSNRLGVHGWSFGGFMTINMMTTYPDVFKVAVAGGPVIDWKWYEVMYGERYMGTPEDNAEGYAAASLLPKAKNLKGRLQIITGMNDPVVVPQHCLSFIDACIKAGTQPDFYVYPGEPHNMRGRASWHLHERITRYFEDYLK